MALVVGVCTIQLDIPANHSLKGKRSVLQPLLARLRKEFNVSVAEVDQQDAWQAATLGIACVSNDAAHAHGLLTRVVKAIEATHTVNVVDYEIEMY